VIALPNDKDCYLETPRLDLVPMVVADAKPLFELLKEPSLYTFIGASPPDNLSELAARIERWERRRSPSGDELWLNWTLRLRTDGKVVGYVQSTITNRSAELAWVIGSPWQGRGYATEAAFGLVKWIRDHFPLDDLRANIHQDHTASQVIARRIGLSRGLEKTAEDEDVWKLRLS
jgi:RimJ/RimL family protein N-acetyltransferase